MGVILLLIDGLILSLSFLGKRISYKLGEEDFTVNFGFLKRRIPYSYPILRNRTFHTKRNLNSTFRKPPEAKSR